MADSGKLTYYMAGGVELARKVYFCGMNRFLACAQRHEWIVQVTFRRWGGISSFLQILRSLGKWI